MSGLAADLARALDPAELAGPVGMTPDSWQADVLRSESDRLLLLCSRQVGKSTAAALAAVHEAVYRPRSLVLLLSPSQRQSSELFRVCQGFYRRLGRPVAAERETALELGLENGSRIVSLPGQEGTIRGYSGVSLLIVDEAARVPDELIASVRPMLAVSSGRLMALSTPFGRRGWFFEAWQYGGPGWERHRVTAEDCPRITAEFLAAERAALGDWIFRQEYECAFTDLVGALFAEAHVSAAFTAAVAPLFGKG